MNPNVTVPTTTNIFTTGESVNYVGTLERFWGLRAIITYVGDDTLSLLVQVDDNKSALLKGVRPESVRKRMRI